MPLLIENVSRDDLLGAVEAAVSSLRHEEDRAAVRAFAETATHFAAGAWSIDHPVLGKCRCPISGSGIDRLQPDASRFASEFDQFFDIDGESENAVFAVDDASENRAA